MLQNNRVGRRGDWSGEVWHCTREMLCQICLGPCVFWEKVLKKKSNSSDSYSRILNLGLTPWNQVPNTGMLGHPWRPFPGPWLIWGAPQDAPLPTSPCLVPTSLRRFVVRSPSSSVSDVWATRQRCFPGFSLLPPRSHSVTWVPLRSPMRGSSQSLVGDGLQPQVPRKWGE